MLLTKSLKPGRLIFLLFFAGQLQIGGHFKIGHIRNFPRGKKTIVLWLNVSFATFFDEERAI